MAPNVKRYSLDEILNKVYDETKGLLHTDATLHGDVYIGAVELKDADTDDRAHVDTGGRVFTKLFASPDGGTTIIPVKCDAQGRIGTISAVLALNPVSIFFYDQTIGTGLYSDFTIGAVGAGKKWIMTDWGVTSADYAGPTASIFKTNGGIDTFLLREKVTATDFQIRRSWTNGAIFDEGDTIKIRVYNDSAVNPAHYDVYMLGYEAIV